MMLPYRAPASLLPDFWQMLALAIPIALAVFAIGVFVYAVYERHAPRSRKKLRLQDGHASPPKFPPAKVVSVRQSRGVR